MDAGAVEVERAAPVGHEPERPRVHLERLEEAFEREAREVERKVDRGRRVAGDGVDLLEPARSGVRA